MELVGPFLALYATQSIQANVFLIHNTCLVVFIVTRSKPFVFILKHKYSNDLFTFNMTPCLYTTHVWKSSF